MNYVPDLGKLVARKKVVPGDPDGSRLFKRIDDGTMPPPDEKPRPSDAEIAVAEEVDRRPVRRRGEAATARPPITDADVYDRDPRRPRNDGPPRPPVPALLHAHAPAQRRALATRNCRPTATRSRSWSTACRGARRS